MKFFEKVMADEYLEYLNESVDSYIKKLKNKNKKSYAEKYLEWKKKGGKGDSPDRGKLGVMGAQAVRMNIDDLMNESINEAPIGAKGWTKASLKKFGKTIGKGPKETGFFDACVNRMKGKKGFDEEKAKGFCASIKDADWGSAYWRGKGKSKKDIKADTKSKKFPKKEQLPKGK